MKNNLKKEIGTINPIIKENDKKVHKENKNHEEQVPFAHPHGEDEKAIEHAPIEHPHETNTTT